MITKPDENPMLLKLDPQQTRLRRAALFALALLFVSMSVPAFASGLILGETRSWGGLLGRLHFILLHLPIGMLVGAFAIEIFGMLKRSKGYDIAAAWLFVLAAASSFPAVLSGLLLASEKTGGQESAISILFAGDDAGISETMGWHMWGGVLLMVFSIAAAVLKVMAVRRQWPDEDRKVADKGGWPLIVARVSLVGVVLMMMPVTGHLGGNMVHGKEYVFDRSPVGVPEWIIHFPDPVPVEVEVSGDADTQGTTAYWAKHIQPVLNASCVDCHGATDQDGKLRLDSLAEAMKGGASQETNPNIVPGEAGESEIYVRVILPKSHSDFMPNSSKYDPLTPEQVADLGEWIQAFDGDLTGAAPAPKPKDEKDPAVATELADTFGTVAYWNKHIQPVMNTHCTDCHNDKKQNGDLRLDSLEWVMKTGDDPIVPGDPEYSEIYRRIILPPSHDEFMPTNVKKYGMVSLENIHKIGEWITKYEGQLKDKTPPKDPKGKGDDKTTGTGDDKQPEPLVDPKAVASILATGGSVKTLSQEDQGFVTIDFTDKKMTPESAAGLEPIADQIVWLSFQRSSISAEVADAMPDMPALTKLNLKDTKVDDATFSALPAMPKLEQLNLFNTKITDASIAKLKGMTSLKRLTLAGTGLTEKGVSDLQAALKETEITSDFGDLLRGTFSTDNASAGKPDATPADKPAKQTPVAAAVNKTCPVSNAPVKPGFVSTYKGKAVGFCCNGCKGKFDADPEKYAAKIK